MGVGVSCGFETGDSPKKLSVNPAVNRTLETMDAVQLVTGETCGQLSVRPPVAHTSQIFHVKRKY